jgi:putative membrane protein
MRPFIYQPEMHQYFWLGAITRLAVLVVIVVGIVMLARYLTHRYPAGSVPGTGAPQQSTAIQILEERFARGEIDDEEFRRRKQALLS